MLSPSFSFCWCCTGALAAVGLLPGKGMWNPEDALIGDAARREVVEETGAVLRADASPLLVSVDVHGIPPRRDEPFHLGHDLIFRFQAEVGCVPAFRRGA